MAGLCWAAVVLTFFLSAGNSLAAVDQNWLTSIIEGIQNEYALGDTFSLAVNVPQNQDPNDLDQVFQDDPADTVKQTVSEGGVYQGTRVVAAAQSGAVSRVLENIQPFIKSSQGNFLIIYSEESPCGPTCTNANEDGIAGKINDITQNWSGYAFVFSKVVDVPGADTSQLSQSFKQLGISKLGLSNIFRCYKPGDDPFQCTSCSSGGDVTPSCVANDAPSNQDQDEGVDMSTDQQLPLDEVANLGHEIISGIGGGTGGRRGEGEGGRPSRCKGRGSRKGSCKGRRGGRRGKGGKVRGGGRRGKGGKVRGGGRRGKGGKDNASVEEAANGKESASVEEVAKLEKGARKREEARVEDGGRLREGAEAKVKEEERVEDANRANVGSGDCSDTGKTTVREPENLSSSQMTLTETKRCLTLNKNALVSFFFL